MSLDPITVNGDSAPVVPAQAIAVGGHAAPAAPSGVIAVGGNDAPVTPAGVITVGGDAAPAAPSSAIAVSVDAAPAPPDGLMAASGVTPEPPDGSIEVGGDVTPEIPEAIVVGGESDPALTYVQPDAPVAVAHDVPLDNTQNYRVMVGSRAAPVVIALPDPGGVGQDIEVIDAAMQAHTHAITISGGSRQIEGQPTLVLMHPGAAVRITYTQAGTWKITS